MTNCNEVFYEPVFIQGNTSFNNASFERICPSCNNKIGAKSVHQQIDKKCKECKIHVHSYYYDTGRCVNINCLDVLSKEYMKKLDNLGREMLFATKSCIEMMRKDGLLV